MSYLDNFVFTFAQLCVSFFVRRDLTSHMNNDKKPDEFWKKNFGPSTNLHAT